MRAHVEVDAYVGLRGVEALQRVQAECAGVLDLQLVAFAQEGILHDDVTQGLLREALQMGLPVLGGCPYMDQDQRRHIDWFFDTAEAFNVPLDFHADSSDDPALLTCTYIAEQTIARGMQGRVVLGHLCTLDMLEPEHRARVIESFAAGRHTRHQPSCHGTPRQRPLAGPAHLAWGYPHRRTARGRGERVDLDQQYRESFYPLWPS